ncbi:S9 family peptidase [Halopseudomonas salegens]|uniref:Oligopeptidase B n=1 Tax=Halopseudomonas salegens TaxID=1434072 RepID=A0A1H2ESD3_9GAMM|nr:S9 family peptidase [Halopseudomonas salegens]SDT98072.1 oligopeptidase B [Halopseudomonas salegens]
MTDTRTPHDPWQWLEQRDHPDVIAWLEAENRLSEAWLSQHQDQREALFLEIRGRIRETDLSLPACKDGWLYYQRTEAGAEYPRYFRCRQQGAQDLSIDTATEDCLLDLNELAGDGFLQLGDMAVSPDHQQLAYSLDRQGDETYQLFLLEIATGQVRELDLPRADGSLLWSNDNRTLFAISMDHTSRPATLWRLEDGQPAVEIYHEADQRFYLHAYRSACENWLFIASDSKNTSEVRLLPANSPTAQPQLVSPRSEGHEYDVDHGMGKLWIRSNQSGENFALYCADPAQPQQWVLHTPCSSEHTLEDFYVQQTGLILQYREQGLVCLQVHSNQSRYHVSMPDPVYSLHLQGGEDYTSPCVRLRYESLNRPAQVRALELATGAQQVLRDTPVEGPFNAADYRVERQWATTADGTRVPISLIGTVDSFQQAAPLYLYGYGAYGASMDPWFSHARLSLLQRGWIYAIAHVRGGADLGEHWYQMGKLENKENTFSDFIACAEHLIASGLTRPDLLTVSGGSAGGLLIGNVLNQRPELFAAAVADVPFVDVWNTMNNPDLPLTIGEYEEWGDPREPDVAARIKGYAPYEQVKPQAYPPLLVTAGYHDVRVQYWEAAKWVARLRSCKTDDQPLLLRTQMDAGHGGASGRYQAMREVAEEYSFLLAVVSNGH